MASADITGRIVKFMQKIEGQSARGPWAKQEVIIESDGQVPRKIAITFWGEKIDEVGQYSEGDTISVGVNIESREYNDRWYTDIKAWKIGQGGSGSSSGGGSNYSGGGNNYGGRQGGGYNGSNNSNNSGNSFGNSDMASPQGGAMADMSGDDDLPF